MSSTTISPQSDPTAYVDVWTESFSQVLGQIAGSAVPFTIAQGADAVPAAESDLWIVCTSSGTLRGEQSFRIPARDALHLAQQFMNQAEPNQPEMNSDETGDAAPTSVTPEHGEAVVELMRQVAGVATDAMKPLWGEVQFHMNRAAGPPSWPASSIFCLRSGEESSSTVVELHLSAALVATLRSERSEPAPAAGPMPPPPTGSIEKDHSQKDQSQLDRLMDVQLAMTLRFGSRRLPLREILEFCPGTVIELDRQIDEPVDLLLHGKLVARGEVVVVDGNYGLRVTEVVSAGG